MPFSMLSARISTAVPVRDDSIDGFAGEIDRAIGSNDDVRNSIARLNRPQG
jgi:hypothetical protein